MVKVKRLTENAILPTRAHEFDAGLDLYADEFVVLQKHITLIKTGIAIELPIGTVGLVLDRSSMAKKGIKVFGGVIDSNYRGELLVGLAKIAPNKEDTMPSCYYIAKGARIAQLVIVPILLSTPYEVQELTETDRQDGKFGSTGV
jgi:dUTP pyrophosphatase